MLEKVFISYASHDEQIAVQIRSALLMRDISVFLAPVSIGAGEQFSDRIATDLPLCKVFLLLWSQHADASPHVAREINLAADNHLEIYPVRLDEHPREKFYTQGLAYADIKRLNADAIAREIAKRLRLLDLPYPLLDLYQRTVKGPPDLPVHIQALQILIRFVTLLHVARYAALGKHSPDLNARIESALGANSLFADLDVARQTAEWLDDQRQPVHPNWNDFFRSFASDLPSLADFESDANDYAGEEFDRHNLPYLFGLAADKYPDEQLCSAVRRVLKEVLSAEWLASFYFTSLAPGPNPASRPRVAHPIFSSEPLEQVRLFWEGGSEPLEVTPFICLMRDGHDWEVSLLRLNSMAAAYSTFNPAQKPYLLRQRLVMPWGSLSITRQLPKVIYAGELHQVQLQLTNHSPEAVTIPKLVEQLPDNLAAPDGTASVEVAADIHLDASESRTLEYSVVGSGVAGSWRNFASDSVPYLFKGQENLTKTQGQGEVIVRTLPEPQLVVTRRIGGPHGDGVPKSVPLDALLTVDLEIRSAGAGVRNISLAEAFEGCEIVAGDAHIYTGDIARLDLQNPITASYQIRATTTAGAYIRLQSTGAAIPIAGAELGLAVRDMPPPRVELRWDSVSRTSPSQLLAVLRFENTGGTSATQLTMEVKAPGDVEIGRGSLSLGRLDSGESQTGSIQIGLVGIPSGSIEFRVSHTDARGTPATQTIALDLNRVIERNIASLPLGGRKKARAEITSALNGPGDILVNLHGVRGSGKRWFLRSEIDRLRLTEGRAIALFEVDCRSDKSFAESVFRLLDDIVNHQAPPGSRGSESAFASFLKQAGMEESEYRAAVDSLRAILAHKAPDGGSWHALALLLPKLSRSKGLNPLVLLFHEVSRFSRAELEGLAVLRRYLPESPGLRIIVTSLTALKLEGIDRSIPIDLLDDEDCKELIGRVFLLPRPSPELEQALIDKSEHLPVNLVSLLQHVVDNADRLIDFDSPSGARIRDLAAFQEIPTSLLESELTLARNSGVSEVILACLAALREPVSEKRLLTVLERMEVEISSGELQDALKACEARQWLRVSAKKYEVASPTIREALRQAGTPAQCELAHQAIFTLYEEEKRPDLECFAHLVESPAEFLKKREVQLAAGLRALVSSGSFTQVRVILNRLHALRIASGEVNPELAVIEHELQWAETGDLDAPNAEALLQKLRKASREQTLIVRLSLLLSQFYGRHMEDYPKAAAVAESCASSWGPFRRFHIDEPELEFEFYLNLWAVYYRLLDEEKFKRVDAQIWKRLAAKTDGQHDSYAIARFLGVFLEFQREFKSLEERLDHFPRQFIRTMNELRPVRDNAIELATRTERLSGTELEQILLHPDKLNQNQNNALVLGRLYLDLGSSLLAQSRTRSPLEGRTAEKTAAYAEDAESYVKRAETLFAEGRFRLDMAHARAGMGGIYSDRLQLAEKSRDSANVKKYSTIAARWLQMAILDFEAVEADRLVADTLKAYAQVVRIWVQYQPDRLGDAIHAYERLVALPPHLNEQDSRDDQRLALVQLYRQAGRLVDASDILAQMEAQTAEMAQLQAILHAAMLRTGVAAIDRKNCEEFERDLESLRNSPNVIRAAAIGDDKQIRTSGDAYALIAWMLVCFYSEQEGLEALRILRAARAEIFAWPPLHIELQTKLPGLLVRLWKMEGPEDDQMTQDFSNLILPLMAPETRPSIEQLLESVWSWEATRRGPVHLAAADMSLALCESNIGYKGSSGELEGAEWDAERKLAADVFGRLVKVGAWESQRPPRMIARCVTFIVRCGAARRDQDVIHNELARLLESLKAANQFSAALLIMVHLVEMLLDVHMSTQNAWYYDVISKLADQLRPLQEQSENNFDEVTHLISVYLQLPTGITDAANLMEHQCKHLLTQKDYKLLPAYLSFLADLLGGALRQDTYLMRILTMADQVDPSAIEGLTAGESARSTALRQVATQLCGDIIAELRKQPISRSASRSVLYNAAKLLPDRDTADLQVAIYLKLYERADHMEGSCVWGAYSAWKSSPKHRASISLADSIALTTFSNSSEEGLDGQIRTRAGVLLGSPRNYLITSEARNALLRRQTRPYGSGESQIVHDCLELQRLLFLRGFIADLSRLLKDQSEFERMSWVTFLHDYLFTAGQGAPFWQKRQRIESDGKRLDFEIAKLSDSLSQMGMPVKGASAAQIQFHISQRVGPVLAAQVRRGRELMSQLVERIRMFTLEDVLGEVHRQLAGQESAVDFAALLGLWTESGQSGGFLDSERLESDEAFLESDPVKLIGPSMESGLRLALQGETQLAEKVYRFALKLCDAHSVGNTKERDGVLRGLIQVLRLQNKHSEAREMADNFLNLLQARSDPEVGSAIDDVVEILQSNDRKEEALPYLAQRVEWERHQPAATRQLIESLRSHFSLLWELHQYAESEPVLRELIAAEEAAPEAPGAQLSADLFQLALLLSFQGKTEDAFAAIERSWQLEPDPESIEGARTLFVCACLALITDRDAGHYIGQLKALIQSNAFERDEDSEVSMDWTDSDLLGKVAAHAPAETAQLMRNIIQAIEDPDSVPKLDRDPQWVAQLPIAPNLPVSDQSLDVGS